MLKKYSEYKKGEEITSSTIDYVYFYADEFTKPNSPTGYIIYKDEHSGRVEHEVRGSTYIERYNNIAYNLSRLEDALLTKKEYSFFSHRIAYAYQLCFDDNTEKANEILKNICDRAYNRRRMKYKINYSLTCLTLVILSIIVALIFRHYDFSLKYWVYSITFGSIGGFFSVSYKLESYEVNDDESWLVHLTNACIRIFISMLSGIIAFMACKGKLIFGNLINDSNIYVWYIICTASGFSELLIPNLFKKVEQVSESRIAESEDSVPV